MPLNAPDDAVAVVSIVHILHHCPAYRKVCEIVNTSTVRHLAGAPLARERPPRDGLAVPL